MSQCPDCAKRLVRVPRHARQRLLYSELYRCEACGREFGHYRAPLQTNVEFIFSRFTRCIRCATFRVHRQPQRDRIDTLSNHPLSWMFRFTFAPLYKCDKCRLQYFDWRKIRIEYRKP